MVKRNADRLAAACDAVVRRSLKIVEIAIKTKTTDEIQKDASMPMGAAPMYLHMARAIAVAAMKGQPEVAVTNNLNVVITGQAPSTAAWLDTVHTAAIEAKEVIKCSDSSEVFSAPPLPSPKAIPT